MTDESAALSVVAWPGFVPMGLLMMRRLVAAGYRVQAYDPHHERIEAGRCPPLRARGARPRSLGRRALDRRDGLGGPAGRLGSEVGSSLALFVKDLGLVAEESQRAGLTTGVAARAARLFTEAAAARRYRPRHRAL